jgi:predicted N-acetyltransferase YhbS
MRVAPAYQRRRIGSSLLSAFTRDLANEACFCVPYSHLVAFYAAAGFRPMPDRTAPSFLQDRLRQYRSDGLDVLVMQRPEAN